MARKNPSFRQLIAYFDREEAGVSYLHNTWSESSIGHGLAEEFEANYAHLPKRKNGNALYHEVIALPYHFDLSSEQQESILIDLVQKYLELRAPSQLAYAKVHHDKEHIHCHLLVSSNELGAPNRKRLSRTEFQQIKQSLERYKLDKYGQYYAEHFFDEKRPQSQSVSQKEFELKKRTGLPSKRQMVEGVVKASALKSYTKEEFIRRLAEAGLEYYERGSKKVPGVMDINSGKRYRLNSILSGINQSSLMQGLHKTQSAPIEQK